MQRTTPCTLLLFTLVALAGCKSEAEKQLTDVTNKQKEMITVLKSVTDQASAKSADPKLKQIAQDLTATFQRMKTTKATQDEQKRLLEKFKAEQEQTNKDMQAEMTRIAKIPGAPQELLDGMMAISSAAMKAQMAR
jgi:thiamine biosynthesis lipoprotein ApbE